MAEATAKKKAAPPAVKTLVVTSQGTPAGAALPVLAALEAAGHRVRAIDVGRVGTRYQSTVERVMKAISAEFAERRLSRELAANPPDVAIAFDPGATAALSELRRHSAKAVPVVAVLAELSPDPTWADVDADRYLTIDAEAAVTLADGGVSAERIMTIGPIAEFDFARAGKQKREVLRARFKLPLSEPVVLAHVAGLGPELTSQLALQLSLIDAPVTYLFAAGRDTDSAGALRRQAPTLSLRAKLFGETDDEALLWRAADVVIAVPSDRIAQRALVLNTKMIALLPEDAEGQRVVAGIEDRGLGTSAANALMISGSLEPLLTRPHKASARTGADGASNVADIATVVGRQSKAVVNEARQSAASGGRTSGSAAPNPVAPGELEDLSGPLGGDLSGETSGDKTSKQATVRTKMDQLSKSIGQFQEAAEQWDSKKAQAERGGDHAHAKAAARSADGERAKMHRALKELSSLEGELRKLEGREARPRPRPRAQPGPRRTSGSSLDGMLNDMKKRGDASVEDELAALKKKMTGKRTK